MPLIIWLIFNVVMPLAALLAGVAIIFGIWTGASAICDRLAGDSREDQKP